MENTLLLFPFRKRRRWLLGLAALLLVLAMVGGFAYWVNPPVQYYGEWMWSSDLYPQKSTLTCVQNPLTRWYELLIQRIPAPAIFICFDTNAEAMNWMLAHLTQTPY